MKWWILLILFAAVANAVSHPSRDPGFMLVTNLVSYYIVWILPVQIIVGILRWLNRLDKKEPKPMSD